MYRGLRVGVVVPAYNEERRLGEMLNALPTYIDRVIVVDDGSSDGTAAVVAACVRTDLMLVRHGANRGVGAAIATGYREALRSDVDVAVVMAGDGQMDPADLPALVDPIADGRAEYAKGNRFRHPHLLRAMPWTRVAGNVLLSFATRFTSGYGRLFDSQCGYTAASRGALAAIEPERLFPRYGYPNDLLGRLALAGVRVTDVTVRPVYGPGWRSGIRPWTVVYPIAFVLLRVLARRLVGPRRSELPAMVPMESRAE